MRPHRTGIKYPTVPHPLDWLPSQIHKAVVVDDNRFLVDVELELRGGLLVSFGVAEQRIVGIVVNIFVQ